MKQCTLDVHAKNQANFSLRILKNVPKRSLFVNYLLRERHLTEKKMFTQRNHLVCVLALGVLSVKMLAITPILFSSTVLSRQTMSISHLS